jgi:hypothetical protein
MNSSIKGPFIPPYIENSFDEIFISQFRGNVHLVSPTIILIQKNSFLIDQKILPDKNRNIYPICQPSMFVLDKCGFEILNDSNFFQPYYENDPLKMGQQKEIMMSCLMLFRKGNIACLLPELQNVNFGDPQQLSNLKYFTMDAGFNPIEPNSMFCRTMSPYDVIFHKNNRNLNEHQVISLSNAKMINRSFKI